MPQSQIMTKTVVIVGALDTKGQEFAFVKHLIEQDGLHTLVVDFGVMGEPPSCPTSPGKKSPRQAAATSPASLPVTTRTRPCGPWRRGWPRSCRTARAGKLDGILGMGGSGGTSIATAPCAPCP